jgi:ABC-type glycerol-3-phosphate transport system substrate-binding protein
MKKMFRLMCVVLLLVCLVCAACGKSGDSSGKAAAGSGDPKAMALEGYALFEAGDLTSAKAQALNARVLALSAEDRAIYDAEITRLVMGE